MCCSFETSHRRTLTSGPSPPADLAHATLGTASARPLLRSMRNVLAYVHTTGVETLLCPAPSYCRAKASCDAQHGSVHAKQSKAALSALCPQQKPPPKAGLALRCSVSALEHIQACWMWGLGHQYQCSDRHPCGFPLEADNLLVLRAACVLNFWFFSS